MSEALMKSVVHSGRIANKNEKDYEARSNIMWTATWAINTLLSMGKTGDWMVHMIGHSIGALTDATHGMTLSAVSLPYYRYIMDAGLAKFVRFAVNVWGIDKQGKTDKEIAEAGLEAMEAWMKELGLTMSLKELGVKDDMLEDIASGTMILEGGYKKLDKTQIKEILKRSM